MRYSAGLCLTRARTQTARAERGEGQPAEGDAPRVGCVGIRQKRPPSNKPAPWERRTPSSTRPHHWTPLHYIRTTRHLLLRTAVPGELARGETVHTPPSGTDPPGGRGQRYGTHQARGRRGFSMPAASLAPAALSLRNDSLAGGGAGAAARTLLTRLRVGSNGGGGGGGGTTPC